MMRLDEHPTVIRFRARAATASRTPESPLGAEWLRHLCLDAGVDDVGFASVDAAIPQALRTEALSLMGGARTLLSLIVRLNVENLRSLSRGTMNLEYSRGFKRIDEAASEITARLRERGVRGVAPPAAYPMDLDGWPKTWPISHKLVAEACGMGRRGRHRLVVHPRFGSAIALGTVLLDAEVSSHDRPLEEDPCLNCGGCVSVCPVGAIAGDGHFTLTSCLIHNNRDRLQGFTSWVEELVESRGVNDYRRRVTDFETLSMWQGLSTGVSNKCSYCMAACPAGDQLVGEYLADKERYRKRVLQPLRARPESIYVLSGSDAEAHVKRHFPGKTSQPIRSGLRTRSVRQFLEALPLAFNRGQARDLRATYEFTFTGEEPCQATVTISDRKVQVASGPAPRADVRVSADSRTWLRVLAKEHNLLGALLRRKIRIKGPRQLMNRFARCFPM